MIETIIALIIGAVIGVGGLLAAFIFITDFYNHDRED